MRGYLLIELLFAILMVTISITSLAYYTYFKNRVHNEAIHECQALSLARNEMERFSFNSGFEKKTYTHHIFTIRYDVRPTGIKGSEYQAKLRVIELEVSWMSVEGTKKSIMLTTIV